MKAHIEINDKKTYFIQQFYTKCIAEAAYYIESGKSVAICDPLRDVDTYIDLAAQRGGKIEYILLTHFHADFVSGHLDLAKKTGAKIVLGPSAVANFDIYVAKDYEELPLGTVKIQVLHTPGHTPESSSFLLLDETGKPACVFTGDTLFLGEVGRPDLACKGDVTKEVLAGWLFDSLRSKIMSLPDEVIVYPGHGAGSPCGKKISQGTFDTIGNQRKTNYALQWMSKQAFIENLTTDLPNPPQYFFHDATVNRQGYEELDIVVQRSLKPIKYEEFAKIRQQVGYATLDSRNIAVFLTGFITGSLNVDLDDNFALFVGQLITPNNKLIIVTEPGREKETIIRLARIGYDFVVGYLEGGIASWKGDTSTGTLVTAQEYKDKIHSTKPVVVDMRNAGERVNGYLDYSVLIPVQVLEQKLQENKDLLPKDKPIYCLCKAGIRAVMGLSILCKYGYKNLISIQGGVDKLRECGLDLTIAKCAKSGV